MVKVQFSNKFSSRIRLSWICLLKTCRFRASNDMSWWHVTTRQTRHKQHVTNILKYMFLPNPVGDTVLQLCCTIGDIPSCEQEVSMLHVLKRSRVQSLASTLTQKPFFCACAKLQPIVSCIYCHISNQGPWEAHGSRIRHWHWQDRHTTKSNKVDLCRYIWTFGKKLKAYLMSYNMLTTFTAKTLVSALRILSLVI